MHKTVQEWNQTLLRGYSSVVYRDSPVSLVSDFSTLATQDLQVIPVTLRWTSVSPSRPTSSLQEPLALELWPWKAIDPLGMNATFDSDYMSCGGEGRGRKGRENWRGGIDSEVQLLVVNVVELQYIL